jgi:XTP/dITP diphosphohydrolase
MLATRNAHKLKEFKRLLAPHDVVPLPDEVVLPPETGDSFEENALVKARSASEQTGRAALADDSGISAAALGGAPGIYSARFAGENATDQENLDKLLRDVPDDGDRRVSYVCALAWVEPGKEAQMFTRTCDGTLALEPRGDGGFGYDPAFLPIDIDDGRTMAELDPDEKDAISHRGRVARAFADWLVSAG